MVLAVPAPRADTGRKGAENNCKENQEPARLLQLPGQGYAVGHLVHLWGAVTISSRSILRLAAGRLSLYTVVAVDGNVEILGAFVGRW